MAGRLVSAPVHIAALQADANRVVGAALLTLLMGVLLALIPVAGYPVFRRHDEVDGVSCRSRGVLHFGLVWHTETLPLRPALSGHFAGTFDPDHLPVAERGSHCELSITRRSDRSERGFRPCEAATHIPGRNRRHG